MKNIIILSILVVSLSNIGYAGNGSGQASQCAPQNDHTCSPASNVPIAAGAGNKITGGSCGSRFSYDENGNITGASDCGAFSIVGSVDE